MTKKILVGFIAGIICGLFTSGGGLVLVPVFIYIFNMGARQARATSLFCILTMVIVTAFFYGNSNFINWKTGILCAIGGIAGGMAGAKLLNKLPEKYLKMAFIILLVYAGINMIF